MSTIYILNNHIILMDSLVLSKDMGFYRKIGGIKFASLN